MNKRNILLAVAITLIFASIMLFSNASSDNKASASTTKHKYYTSISIEDGDSLWSIAEKYAAPESGSYSDFISEVKQINDLHGDQIEYGCSIVIPQYK
ncbi:MAG: hypothetical protein IJJ74_02965 [Eubacterium sp.]|nr:hypothetical protein [Eubacterium sp.]MBR1674781.1 hypothetical protein [Eubacterium sp.]